MGGEEVDSFDVIWPEERKGSSSTDISRISGDVVLMVVLDGKEEGLYRKT